MYVKRKKKNRLIIVNIICIFRCYIDIRNEVLNEFCIFLGCDFSNNEL